MTALKDLMVGAIPLALYRSYLGGYVKPAIIIVDRQVPRKPRSLGRGQGAQYKEITFPGSPAL